jgi:uncharacterized protein YcnI
MKKVTISLVVLSALAAAPAFAHVTVAPQQSRPGATQEYKVRVHNDGKTPTATVALQFPECVTIAQVAPVAGGTSDMTKVGDRVSVITWKVEVPVGKYVELAFTAKNPAAGKELNWNVTEKFTDGSIVEYTNKPGAKEKSSVTMLTTASTPASTTTKTPAASTTTKTPAAK